MKKVYFTIFSLAMMLNVSAAENPIKPSKSEKTKEEKAKVETPVVEVTEEVVAEVAPATDAAETPAE